MLDTPNQVLAKIASRAKTRRLALNFTQQTLADRAGVSYGSLKKFERTGQISLQSLLKLALVLDALPDFATLFTKDVTTRVSLDELLQKNTRKRGRR